MQQAPTHSPEAELAADEPKARRSRRLWLWLVAVPIVLPVVLVLAYNAVAAFHLSRALNDLRKRGEPVTYREAHALLLENAPDDDDNLAKVPALLALQRSNEGRAALQHLKVAEPSQYELLHNPDLYLHGTTRMLVHAARRRALNPDPTAEPIQSMHELTAELHPAVDELAAATRGRSRAFWNWTEVEDPQSIPSMDMAFHGLDMKRVPKISGNLAAITFAAIDADDPELATAAIELKLALMRATYEGNAQRGGWEVMYMRRSITSSLYKGLQRRVWDEEQLQRLQSAIELSLPSLDLQPFLRMERIHELHVNRIYKRDRARLAEDHPHASLHPAVPKLIGVLPGGAFDNAALRGIEIYAIDSLQPGGVLPPGWRSSSREPPAWLEGIQYSRFADSFTMLRDTFRPDPWPIQVFAIGLRTAETRLRLAHATVVLERFHLQHGRYPTDWRELMPAVLTEVPLDPFTGDGLRLLPVDEDAGRTRPVVYSLGLNRTDNGGVPSDYDFFEPFRNHLGKSDLVWAFPEEEAQVSPEDKAEAEPATN